MSLRKISFVCFRETFYQLISESAGRSAARTARDPQIADIWVCVRGFDLKPIDSTTPALPFAALMQHCSLTTGLFLVKIIKKKTGLCFYTGQNKAPCLQTCTWRSRNPRSSRSASSSVPVRVPAAQNRSDFAFYFIFDSSWERLEFSESSTPKRFAAVLY